MTVRKDILSLQQRVISAKRTLDELKRSPQPMSGDSWVFYRNMSTGWDLEVHNITSPSYEKLFKVTLAVEDPSRGFANIFNDYAFDTEAQNMSHSTAPVRGDPYSIWVRIKHSDYNSDSAGMSLKFYFFAPQRGIITVTEM